MTNFSDLIYKLLQIVAYFRLRSPFFIHNTNITFQIPTSTQNNFGNNKKKNSYGVLFAQYIFIKTIFKQFIKGRKWFTNCVSNKKKKMYRFSMQQKRKYATTENTIEQHVKKIVGLLDFHRILK